MAGTDIQHLEKLRSFWKRHHAFPSMAKLCEVVGLSSTASVFHLVSRLKDAGYVERVEGRIAPTKRFFARPLVGSVRAGLPQPAPDEDFEVLTIRLPRARHEQDLPSQGQGRLHEGCKPARWRLGGGPKELPHQGRRHRRCRGRRANHREVPAAAAGRALLPAGGQPGLRRHPAHGRARDSRGRDGAVPLV